MSIAESKLKSAYILRHWLGELSLPVAYWVNGMLVSLGIVMMFAVVISIIPPNRAASVGIIGFLIMLRIWQVVGIWRSANRYNGPWGWALAAKVAVVIGIIRDVAEYLKTTS